MKRWFYFYRLNGLMVRFLSGGNLLWVSYGHRAQWQFKLGHRWWRTWPTQGHRHAIYSFGFVSLYHTRDF
jgi:hypothetical protein